MKNKKLIVNVFGIVPKVKHDYRRAVKIYKNGIVLTIPEAGLKLSGFIKADIVRAIKNLTVENIEYLNHKYGVTAELRNSAA